MPTVEISLSLHSIDKQKVSISVNETPESNSPFIVNVCENNGAPRTTTIHSSTNVNFADGSAAFYYVYITGTNNSPDFTANDIICRSDNGIIVIGADEVEILTFLEQHTNYAEIMASHVHRFFDIVLSENSCFTLSGLDNADIAGSSNYRYCCLIYNLIAEGSSQWIIQNFELNPTQNQAFSVGAKAFTSTTESGDQWLSGGETLDTVYVFYSYNALAAIS